MKYKELYLKEVEKVNRHRNDSINYQNWYELEKDKVKKLEEKNLFLRNLKTKVKKDKLLEILNNYFDIDKDCYYYNLTRIKTAKQYGILTIDDFEEFTNVLTDELAEFIVKHIKLEILK